MSTCIKLLPHHQKLIDESGISPEVAAARGYRSISVRAELERLGFGKNQCRVPALMMPVWDVHREITLYQARPDEPRIKGGKSLKYETPHKARMSVDVPPTAHPRLGDPKRPLFITEGIRKADSAVSKGLCCVALLGVWNWRGTNDDGGTTALPDWENITLKGRQAYICFDSDVMTKPPVHTAMARLKAFLEKRGAAASVIYLPSGDGGAKVGLDDYLADHSVDELLAFAAKELREPQTDNGQAGSENGQEHSRPSPDQLLAEIPESIRQEAEQMLMDPELINRIVEDIAIGGVVGEEELGLTVYLVGTSRLLDNPLGAIIQGPSSTGKSYVIDRVADMFPETEVLRATDITSQALYYLPTGTLEHVFVIAGERSRKPDDERAEATRALREMLSAGQLTKVVTTGQKGRFESEVIHQSGPIAYVESTTQPTIFDEDSNRCLLLGTDESAEQTRAIMQAAARAAMGRSNDTSGIIARHHALQLMLRPVQVKIPFAEQLQAAFPSSSPNARRAFPHVLNVIRAVALLHQRQRVKEHIDDARIIEAEIADYVVARRLLLGPLARALGGALSPAATNFGKRLADRHASNVFTSIEALRGDDILTSRGKINEHLKALGDAGVLELVEPGKGNQPARWQVVHVVPEAGAVWLPEVAAMTDQNTPSPPVCV